MPDGALQPSIYLLHTRAISISKVFSTRSPVRSYAKNTKMLNKKLLIVSAVLLALVLISECQAEGPHDMADAIRMLQELDRYYTQAARPRIGRRDVATGDRVDPDLLDRAVRLLQLQTLDRIYSYHTRPRFGKRSEFSANYAKDVEKPDLPAWFTYGQNR